MSTVRKKKSEDGPGPDSSLMPGIDLSEILPVVWKARRQILLLTGAVTLITFLLNYLVFPLEYTATTTLLPEAEQTGMPPLGGVADLAQLAGMSLPDNDMARLYPSIIESETLLEGVLDRLFRSERFDQPVRLTEYFEHDEEDPARAFDESLNALRKSIDASYDPRTNIVTVQAVLHESRLVSDVLNAVVEELDSFMKEKRVTNASERRRWIEQRLIEVEGELKTAEETLTAFRERNRRVVDSPQLLQEQGRLSRSVEISSTVFVELKKQHELARIEELRNVPVVNVLDRARAPVRKSGPRRSFNTLLAFVVAMFATSSIVALRHAYGEKPRRDGDTRSAE